MNRMLILGALALTVALAAPATRADSGVTGRASLTMWFDYTNDVGSIDLWEKDGKIQGHSSFSNWPISFAAELTPGFEIWKGNADEGYVEFTCGVDSCQGQLGSDTLQLKLSEGNTKLEGSLNHVHVDALNTVEKIEVRGDGALDLRKKKEGRYNGSGFLDQGFESRFTATLKLEGTLKDKIADPGFFTIFLVAPFVRN
jgi:hypothetical protein